MTMTPIGLTDAQWEALSEGEREEYISLQEDLAGGESLRDFIARMSPHHPPPRHLDPVIEQLEICRLVRKRKVCISMPPGHAKTTLLINAFAWWLAKFTSDTCAYYSYNTSQALSKSVLARALALRAGVELSDETNNKAEWRTVDGGGLLAGGVGGAGGTGQRAHGLVVVDDPYAGPVDATSAAYRNAVDEWFKTVAMTRRMGASVFVIHTRWHDDDLIGRLKKRGWLVINLPALAEENDLLGRQPGEALWPEQYPVADLLEAKREAGEFNFAALYQGSPRPRGGAVFGEPHYYDPATFDITGWRIVLSADPAASEKTSADYSAAVVMAVRGEGAQMEGRLLHVYRQQVAIPQFARDLLVMQRNHGDTAINIESVGAFKAIPQMLREINPDLRIREVTPVGDKFTRAQPVAAAWNDGRFLVPANGPPWLGAFLDELAKFTGVNDRNDDQVDALSLGWNGGDTVPRFRPTSAETRAKLRRRV
jgi:predicted phage terminase large subunit-like protein